MLYTIIPNRCYKWLSYFKSNNCERPYRSSFSMSKAEELYPKNHNISIKEVKKYKASFRIFDNIVLVPYEISTNESKEFRK